MHVSRRFSPQRPQQAPPLRAPDMHIVLHVTYRTALRRLLASPALPAPPAAAGARDAPLGQQLSSSSTARLLAACVPQARSRHRRFAHQKEGRENAVVHVQNHSASSGFQRCNPRLCSKLIAGCASRLPLTLWMRPNTSSELRPIMSTTTGQTTTDTAPISASRQLGAC